MKCMPTKQLLGGLWRGGARSASALPDPLPGHRLNHPDGDTKMKKLILMLAACAGPAITGPTYAGGSNYGIVPGALPQVLDRGVAAIQRHDRAALLRGGDRQIAEAAAEVEHAAGLDRSSQSSGHQQRNASRIVFAPRPHIVDEQQARVVEHCRVPFGHATQFVRQIGELTDVVTRNAFVFFARVVV